VIVNDLLKLAIEGHGGLRRWEQFTRFRVAGSFPRPGRYATWEPYRQARAGAPCGHLSGQHRGPHPPADVLLRFA